MLYLLTVGLNLKGVTDVLFATSYGWGPIHLDNAAVGGCVFSRPVYPSPPLRWWGERALGGRVLMHNSLTICAFEVAAGLDLWLWNDGGGLLGVCATGTSSTCGWKKTSFKWLSCGVGVSEGMFGGKRGWDFDDDSLYLPSPEPLSAIPLMRCGTELLITSTLVINIHLK